MPTDHGLDDLAQKDGPLEVVVDLSNVCRVSDTEARWDRILLVLQAWNRWEKAFDRPVVRLVADDNLKKKFAREDKRRYDAAVQDGFVVEFAYADPEILRLAEVDERVVISNDKFVGLRREFPWLNDNRQRIVGHDIQGDRAVLSFDSLPARTHYSMSRAEERDEIKARKLDRPQDREILTTVYRCSNVRCAHRQLAAGGPAVPVHKPGVDPIVCHWCEEPLAAVGPVASTTIVKVGIFEDDKWIRVALDPTAPLVIGRFGSDISLRQLAKDPARLVRVSRRHLQISLEEGAVMVQDLGSSNGTTIERWDDGAKTYAAGVPLEPRNLVRIRPRDLVRLAGQLAVQVSGRRFDPYAQRRESSPGDPGQTVVRSAEP